MNALDLQASISSHVRAPRQAADASRLQTGTVVCDACGCRLTTRESIDDSGFDGDRTWWHFAGHAGRDARGCTVGPNLVALRRPRWSRRTRLHRRLRRDGPPPRL